MARKGWRVVFDMVSEEHARLVATEAPRCLESFPVFDDVRGVTARVVRPSRTGPSVAARLAHLETEHAALVVRVGELERLPVGSEDVSPISEAARNGPPEWCRDLVPPTEEPAPVRPEPGSVAEDPDRLAKVAHRAADKLTTWGNLHEPTRDIYRAIATAVAEACAEDRVASMGAAEAAAFQRDGARPSVPTPIVRVPVESAGADGARLSEHRMCSDLAADGMSPFYAANGSRRWMRRNFATPSDIESAPTTAVAYAAMRAAKGAK